MIVTCKECGKQISEFATACPFCGCPLRQVIQRVEQTGKEYKAGMLISAGIFILAFAIMMNTGETELTVLFMCLSLLGFVGCKIGAWWNHG